MNVFKKAWAFRNLACFLVIVGFAIAFARSEQVLIKHYSCKTQYGRTCDEKDQELLKKYVGSNFFTTNPSAIENDLDTNFINERVSVQKVIPARINAFIIKRKPIVAAKVVGKESSLGYFSIDKEGHVLSFVSDSSLGILKFKQEEHKLVVGSKTNDKFKQAAGILYQNLRTFGAKSALVEGNNLKVELPENIIVNYSLDKDPSLLGASLQLILIRSRIDGKLPKTIDLRYKNPILTY